jgi:hypothetical protein
MANIKAKVVTKPAGKTGDTNGTAKVQKSIKAKPSGKVNTPPKGAIPMKKMGGMYSKKSC